MFEHKDDCSHWQLAAKRADEFWVNDGGADVLEAARHSLQDFDGIFARFCLSVSAEQPRCDRQHDDDECIPKNGDEEKNSL